MRAFTKACAVAGLFLAATGVAPAASAAVAPSTGCAPGDDGYGGDAPCEIDVLVLEPVCDGDVPRLRYAVTPPRAEDGTVEIAFVNPGGGQEVLEAQPLSGSVLWPGAVVDDAGAPVDWPGWRLVDGAWVAGDEYDWVRPSVQVSFTVGEHLASAVVAYPSSAPDCDPEVSEVLVADDDEPRAVPAPRLTTAVGRPALRVGPADDRWKSPGRVALSRAGRRRGRCTR